ncbi:MAG: hypothetical protein ACLFQ6_13440, partial [Candidatus Sumerlaeia bacterium]
ISPGNRMETNHGVRRLADAFFVRNISNEPKPRNSKARASPRTPKQEMPGKALFGGRMPAVL